MIKNACDYHDFTSYHRYKMGGHALDWSNQPSSFKRYEGLKTLQLEDTSDLPQESLSELLKDEQSKASKQIDLRDLSRILRLSHCLTHKQKSGTDYFYFRNVASAGALYPFEIYFASVDVLDLEQGLYHHSVADQSIALLRKGNCLDALSTEIQFQRQGPPSLFFFLTAIFFRSAWKYRERAFRYHLLDTGHLAENLILALGSAGLNFELSYDFNDSAINELLVINVKKEVCLAAVKVFSKDFFGETPRSVLEQPSTDLQRFSSCASEEKHYPTISAIHDITSVKSTLPGIDLRRDQDLFSKDSLEMIKLESVGKSPELINYSQALLNRRSRRNFIRQTIPANTFSWLLSCFTQEASPEVKKISWRHFLTMGVLIADVEGIVPGFYLIEPYNGALRLVRSGLLTEEMAHICLDQMWLSNCSCHFLFLADLSALEEEFGPRSYRYVMLEAGRQGQLLYLAAESIKLGCCGIGAFYDSEAREFLNLRSSVRLLYLVSFGSLTKAFA
ncbi:MAG: SagB/ThcOx family dehydrogenase [Deltaproteobacteria bacterium]|nr:SagB/ThcOx family dehydrogenase [Deltaproteobacteria bacterium]